MLREAVQQHDRIAVARLGDVQAGAAYLDEAVRQAGYGRERPGAGSGGLGVAGRPRARYRASGRRRGGDRHGFLLGQDFSPWKRNPGRAAFP